MEWIFDDGGRKKSGFTGTADDCVCRAIAIATGEPYRKVYDELATRMKAIGKAKSARNGIPRKVYESYLYEQGWEWTPTMQVGKGCQVHLKNNELPNSTIIVRLSKHLSTIRDGHIRDTHDSSRGGTRCVYGYYSKGTE